MTRNELVEVLRTSLTRFNNEAASYVTSQGPCPKPGSIAATERKT